MLRVPCSFHTDCTTRASGGAGLSHALWTHAPSPRRPSLLPSWTEQHGFAALLAWGSLGLR